MSTIFTLYSKEDHIGKTTFGVNLGVSLLQETQQPVILLDLDTHGDGLSVSSILKTSSAHPLQTDTLTAELIDAHIHQHSSQLAVLTVDANIIRDETIARSFMGSLLVHLQHRYVYILIDVPTQPLRTTYEAIEHSSLVIFFLRLPNMNILSKSSENMYVMLSGKHPEAANV